MLVRTITVDLIWELLNHCGQVSSLFKDSTWRDGMEALHKHENLHKPFMTSNPCSSKKIGFPLSSNFLNVNYLLFPYTFFPWSYKIGTAEVSISSPCQYFISAVKAVGNKLPWVFHHLLLLLPLSHFSCVHLCATPETAAHQAPPSLGFSRQEHWRVSFRDAWKWKVKVKSLSRVRLLVTPWTAADQAPLSMGFAREESSTI